jgi:Spy/CpxP family protein refolding chaperone
MEINVYHHFLDSKLVSRKLDEVLKIVREILRKEDLIMATLDEGLAAVTEATTVVEGLSTLVYAIKAQLDQALAGVLTPEQQAKVDAVFAGVQGIKAKAAQALLDNTPQA